MSTTSQLQQLYVAYFNRPADPLGLAYWTKLVDSGAATLAQVATAFSTTDEYKDEYKGLNSAQAVNKVYVNLFGHTADLPGLEFWVNALNSGNVTMGLLVQTIANGALGTDKDAVAAKVAAAGAFTDSLTTTGLVLAYNGVDANGVAKKFLVGVTDSASLAAATTPAALAKVDADLVNASNAAFGKTFDLTTGVDTLVGTAGDDVFNAVLANDATKKTLTALDSIDGGAGVDTLKIFDLKGGSTIPGSVTIKNVEIIELSSAGQATINTTGGNISGVKTINVVQGSSAIVTAGAGTAVNVAVDDYVSIDGGSTQTVTNAGGMNLSGATGAIVVTDTEQSYNNISIDGGTNVSLTTTVSLASGAGGVQISNAAGAVTVVENIVGNKNVSAIANNIVVNGGTTVSVTENATQAIATPSTAPGAVTVNSTVYQANVNINGGASTTTVVVKQTAAVAENHTTNARAEVVGSSSVKFGAIKSGDSITIDGMTFTAAKDLTAAQAAAAFANLTAGSKQGSAPVATGTYSGIYSGHWATGAAATDTLVFSNTTSGALGTVATGFIGAGTGPVATLIANGVTGIDADAGVGGIVNGAVTIKDAAYASAGTGTIANVTLDAYASGSSISSDALTKLSLANAKGATVNVSNRAAAALDLTVNNVTGTGSALNLDAAGAPSYTSLAVHTAGASSTVNVTAAGVQTLTIDGAKSINLTNSTLTALKTVAITGAAGVTAGLAFNGNNVTDVNASGTSGAVSATINASKATYEGGSGVDTITLSSNIVSKAISLGAGDDTLVLAAGTTTLGAIVDGGAGTADTLKMDAADAATASTTGVFASKFVNFEKLSLGQVVAGGVASVDLSNMNNLNYVISAGTAAATPAKSEVQTLAVTGVATGPVTFLGSTVGSSTLGDSNVTTAGNILANKVGIIAAWNIANPTAQIADITGDINGVLTITYLGTMGDVANLVGNTSAGINFAGSIETTKGVLAVGNGALTLTHMVDGGTLELTGAGSGATVTMTDATGTNDTFHIVTKLTTADVFYGTVNVAGVENVTLSVNDTAPTNTLTGAASIQKATLNLKDAAVKSLVITGNAHLDLLLDSSDVALTSIDGSAATGKLNIATLAGAGSAVTVKGGSGADVLIANHQGDILDGGVGNDTLIANADLVMLTGGTGNDIFDVSKATSNVNAYATIMDLNAGDTIKLAAGAATFAASKVALGDTAVFQDFANAAINQTAIGTVSWFQFGGNTYVIENVTHESSFHNGTDIVVKIAGVVDLSTASFSSGTHMLVAGPGL